MMTMGECELPEYEQIALNAIKEIQELKKSNQQFPDFANKTEIYNSIKVEIMEALRSLYRKGLIEFHRNVNGIEMFGLKENEK